MGPHIAVIPAAWAAFWAATHKEEWVLADHRELGVSLICASQSLGGTEQIVRLLAKGLHKEGSPVRLLTMGEANAPWLSTSGVEATPVHSLCSSFGGLFSQVRDLRRRFKALRGSVVNIHYPTCDIYRSHIIGLRLAGCRNIVVSLHHPHLESRERAVMNRRFLGMCKAVVVTTEANRRFVLENELVDPKLVHVITPGIDAPTVIDKAEARAALGLPPDKFLVGILCRLAPEKRVEQVIEACRLAPAAHLVIGGTGPEAERLATLAAKDLPGRHTILGWQEKPDAFYSAIDVFAMLSELEGFGLAYMEAAAHGVPSLGCNTGGTADAIAHGSSGFIVPVEAPAVPASEHVSSLSTDTVQYSRMSQASRERYESQFTLEKMVGAYWKLYAQVAGRA